MVFKAFWVVTYALYLGFVKPGKLSHLRVHEKMGKNQVPNDMLTTKLHFQM